MRRPVLAWIVPVVLVGLVAGCGLKGTPRPDVPPETRIFVQGSLATVDHTVHLYWFGTDPDGTIKGFEIRTLDTGRAADSVWTFTTRTDSVFSFYAPTGSVAPTFEVRAIDNAGLKDPPPARQDFRFTNQPPVVTITNKFAVRDTTFASATISWRVTDPDNDLRQVLFRVWLDGNAAAPNLVTGTTFTVPSDQFLQGGQYTSARRTLYIQAVDDGGMAGNVDSTAWFVRAPATQGHTHPGRLLILDDSPSSNTQDGLADTLYSNTAERNLPEGSYNILRTQFTQPFRSSKDLEQTFKLFDAVVWYIGGKTNFITYSTLLQNYSDGIGAYLDSGGNLYLDGLDLIGTYRARGPLTETFAKRYLGTDGFALHFDNVLMDSTGAWSSAGGRTALLYPTGTGAAAPDDSLSMVQSQDSGLRGFLVHDPAYALIVAPTTTMSPNSAYPMTIAVSVPQSSGGRAIVVSFPMAWTRARDPKTPRVLAKIFGLLGLTGP